MDFIYILVNVLLENHILFFSRNQNLLTHSMLTFSTAVKPFQYTQPFCNCLEEMGEHGLEIICGAITHSFFGINSSSDDFLKTSHYRSLTRSQKEQILVYDLDKKCIYQPVLAFQYMYKFIPFYFLSNNPIKTLYYTINSDNSKHFQSNLTKSEIKVSPKI